MFRANEYDRKTLQKIITRSINNNDNNNTNKKQTITLPWIPNIGPMSKKEIQKFTFE